jgi:hypothetical protein
MIKALWIWQIKNIQGGDPAKIAAWLHQNGFRQVFIKVADGYALFNVDKATGKDLVPPLVDACRALGIRVWGWQYFYGATDSELAVAFKRIEQLKLDGYIIDAEGEFKTPAVKVKTESFLKKFRAKYPALDLAFSSFRFPHYHLEFPWAIFAKYCNVNMPQVYWEQAHNAGSQLRTALDEHRKYVGPSIEFFPVGAAYNIGTWRPTPADEVDFLKTAKSLNLELVSFWSADELAGRCGELLPPIVEFERESLPIPEEPNRLPELITRMNKLQASVSSLTAQFSELVKFLADSGLMK